MSVVLRLQHSLSINIFKLKWIRLDLPAVDFVCKFSWHPKSHLQVGAIRRHKKRQSLTDLVEVSRGSAHLTHSSVSSRSYPSPYPATVAFSAKVQIRANASSTFPIGIWTHFELLTRFWFVIFICIFISFYLLLMRRNPGNFAAKVPTFLSKLR